MFTFTSTFCLSLVNVALSYTIAVFWSLYTNDTFSTLSLNTNPSGAFISLTEYSPSGSVFDVAFPSAFVVIVSTTVGTPIAITGIESTF